MDELLASRASSFGAAGLDLGVQQQQPSAELVHCPAEKSRLVPGQDAVDSQPMKAGEEAGAVLAPFVATFR